MVEMFWLERERALEIRVKQRRDSIGTARRRLVAFLCGAQIAQELVDIAGGCVYSHAVPDGRGPGENPRLLGRRVPARRRRGRALGGSAQTCNRPFSKFLRDALAEID